MINCFEATDTYDNLLTGLSGYSDQMKELVKAKWQGKSMKLIGFGDCDFLATIFGIAGASGTYPCYVCLVHKNTMQVSLADRADSTPRTLAVIRNDYQRFVNHGENKKDQSRFHNVIHEPLLPIEPSDVCIPYLHILLGLTLKHHDLMELYCNDLDIAIATELAKTSKGDDSSPYQQLVKTKNTIHQMEKKIFNLNSEIEDLGEEENMSLNKMAKKRKKKQQERDKIHKKVESLKKNLHLKPGSGPVAASLDVTLKKHNIERKKYFGKTFVGNDCVKYARPGVYFDVCNSIVKKTNTLTNNPKLQKKAIQIYKTFRKLFYYFSTIHFQISHSRALPDDCFPRIDQAIKAYMKFYRKRFPKFRITLKQHMLEEHVLPFLMKWKVGFGFLGEQGGESIHHKVAVISRHMVGIRQPSQRLLATVQEHHLHANPEVRAMYPMIKKRKKSN